MKKESYKKFFLFLSIAVILSFMISTGLSQKDTKLYQGQSEKTISISIGHKQIKVLVADTPELRAKGLGGRESISPSEAMLFVFETPARYDIWMKDMKFPIDIFWLDQSRRVIFVKEGALPASYPEVFIPDSLAKYVLETSTGFARKNNLKVGSEISFSASD
ncbi:MAG: hypothetical protein UV05_C0009G0010 [candidate division CPR1 bacterium GW2011_GWA2_42_17]|uniref:DUF192 domain-containing protein n=1 Tax=candidate division CPR1 bacterium GW2011_GWA2_42_17 TaxID=1618341 RepID=A0A0G1BCZ7_9BACT|nr:MAG: hypothetical protein UV05_C0009G0010 [candidate division CPR1 bacterium GW2011_GWA2_42_17]